MRNSKILRLEQQNISCLSKRKPAGSSRLRRVLVQEIDQLDSEEIISEEMENSSYILCAGIKLSLHGEDE